MKKTLLITLIFIIMVCIFGTSSRLDARIDPLKIIRSQTPPNAVAYVVMDTTGSLSFPVVFDDGGVDAYTTSNGHYVARWHFQGPTGTSCSSSNYATDMGDFTTQSATSYYPYRGVGQGYWLKASTDTSYSYWYFVPPSRMAIFKNVFGPYIRIYHVPEVGDPNYPINPTYGPFTDKCNKPYYRFPLAGGPTGGAYYNWSTKLWVNWTANNTTEPAGDTTYTTAEAPVALFQNSSDVIDWGLLEFSNLSATNAVTASTASDQTANITALNATMNTIVGDPTHAIDPNNGTCTNVGLDLVKAQLNTVYSGDQFRDCRRYVAILITDGQSNNCNCCGCSGTPGEDAAWGNTCPNYTNLTTLKKYPPGRTDEIFLKVADATVSCCTHSSATTAYNFQSFVIGVSDAVAKCELNLDAFMGRTDAANAADAGLNYANDTDTVNCPSAGHHCLPTNTSGATALTNYVATRNYAFFSNNAEDIKDAFGNIIAALTKGDYSVSDPVAVQSIAGTGSILLSSTRTPGWFGTIRRWDIADPDSTDSSNHVVPYYDPTTWCDNVNDTGSPQAHIIYYSGVRTQKHFHLIWDAGCSLKIQYNATNNVDHNRKIYTVASACNKGTSSGPSAACQNMRLMQKDDATVTWLRTNINITWSSYDFNKNGVFANVDNDDVKMLIDWILGGQGTVAAGDSRFWQIADIINGTPVTIGRPLPYTTGKNIPYKGSFDAIHYGRKKIIYFPSNDGMIHALMFDHNPRDATTTQNIELFAFLSPLAFNNIALMLNNYLTVPNGSTTYPVGQKPDINFDYHYWNLSAPPSYADIWVNWAISGAGDWRTLLFVPLGPTQNGVYALDVTDPTKVISPAPMVSVLWHWDGSDITGSTFTKETWSVMPIGLSQAGGKTGNAYRRWIVGLSGTQSGDTDTNNITVIAQADTGESLTNKILLPPSPAGMVPFHAYGNVAFMESDYPIYLPDALVTHTFNSDTAGRIHVLKLNYDSTASWTNNTPAVVPSPAGVDKGYGTSNPIHYSPSVAHGVQTDAMVLASITGSIFETAASMNGASSTFTTKAYLDVLDVNKTSWNVTQPDATKQHREWSLMGTYMVDTNGDGTPDTTEYLSQLTRATNRPLLVVQNGVNGTVYYLVFDIMHLNPEYGVCTGKSYLYPVNFVLQKFTTGSAGAGFTSASAQPMLSLAYGVVTGITSGSEKIVAGVTGYGVNGVAMPEFTPYGDFTPPNTLPRLRSVKRLM